MHRTSIILRNSNLNREGCATIYVQYSFTREDRTLINTGKRVKPEDWNPSKSLVKRTNPDHKSINIFIQAKKREVEQIADHAVLTGAIPTVEYVRNKLAGPNKPSSQSMDLSSVIDSWIESKIDQVSGDVIKDYRSLKKHIIGFKESRRRRLRVHDLTQVAFYDDFIRYLENEVEVRNGKKGLMKSSVGKQIKNLKVFLRHCMKHEVIPRVDLDEFKKPNESSDAVYVNEKELDMLISVDLTDSPKLDRVRDLFIVGCETGLRYSDLSKVTSDHISDGLIRKPVRKTGKKVVIPISKRLQGILDKCKGDTPKAPNAITFNQDIKTVCQLAGIDTPFSRIIQRGNRKEETTVPKYEVISSHTCRRSFCTNQFLKGMPALLIRKISGHATEKAFLQYIKIDEEKAAEEMARRWVKLEG